MGLDDTWLKLFLWPFKKPRRTFGGPLTLLGDLLQWEVCRCVREGRFIEPETWHLSQIFTVRGLRRGPRAKNMMWGFYPVLLNLCWAISFADAPSTSPTVNIFDTAISTPSLNLFGIEKLDLNDVRHKKKKSWLKQHKNSVIFIRV